MVGQDSAGGRGIGRFVIFQMLPLLRIKFKRGFPRKAVMLIPTSFKLYGQKIEVKRIPDLTHREDARGLAVYKDNEIHLQCGGAVSIPGCQVEQVFCHELMHFILYMAGYNDLRADEAFIERTSHLLHQALTTME